VLWNRSHFSLAKHDTHCMLPVMKTSSVVAINFITRTAGLVLWQVVDVSCSAVCRCVHTTATAQLTLIREQSHANQIGGSMPVSSVQETSLILWHFCFYHVQNGSRAHPASYPMGTRGSFPGVKRLGREANHSPPSSAEVKECVELYLHSPNTPSWRDA
jgi:hypothetical protein